MGQWIACTGYASVSNLVNGGENLVLPLCTMPDYTTVDPSGLEDDAISGDFIVERVVGQVTAVGAADGTFLYGWRLMALPYLMHTAQLQPPWAVTDSPLRSVDIANMPRWWGERFRQSELSVGYWDGLDAYSHPHWTFVDLHPKELCGPHSGVWPAIVFDNVPNPGRYIGWHRLRMYVTLR